jgi:hypothetical protein
MSSIAYFSDVSVIYATIGFTGIIIIIVRIYIEIKIVTFISMTLLANHTTHFVSISGFYQWISTPRNSFRRVFVLSDP